jgi:hypothetical protein
MSTPDVVVVKDLWSVGARGHQKTSSLSPNIPTLHGRTASASRPTSSPGKSQPQKLRLQSPAKLRERLQNEAKAINEAEAGLRSEISKIGEEMAKLNVSSPDRSPRVQALGTTLENLESRVREFVEDFTARNDALKNEVEKSLQASELKVKGLDQLYIESSAENELLYDKFNGELGKIVRALRGKGREDKEELVSKVKERSEETAKVKKENSRLKREVLTLRTLLKGNDCNSCVSANALFGSEIRYERVLITMEFEILYTTLRKGGGARLVCTYCTVHTASTTTNELRTCPSPFSSLASRALSKDIGIQHFLIFALREGYRDLLSVLKLKGMLNTRPCLFRATTLDEGYDSFSQVP